MPPRRKRTGPVIDIDALRTAFDAGKIVRVGIAPSSQFPDGGTGRVRGIGDPAVEEEFIQVELTVGGAKDTVPFAPADLVPAQRGTKPVAKPAAEPTEPAPTPPKPSEPTWTPAPTPSRAPEKTAVTPPATTSAAVPAPKKPAKPATPRGKRAPVTITIATTGEDNLAWQVSAQQGSRTVIKASAVSPLTAWQLVDRLGNEDLTGYVAGILTEHRAQAEARATRLAEELAAVQAELAGYPDSKA